MPASRVTHFVEPTTPRLVAIRVLGHLALAAIVLAIEPLGADRFPLAAFILLVAAPCALWIGLHYRDPAQCWIDPLCDLSLIVVAAWCIPSVWVACLCLGIMVALSPSVSLHPRSNFIYSCYGTWLLVGLGSAFLFRVPTTDVFVNEGLILFAIAAVYPTLIVYANWQRRRAAELMERSNLLNAITDISGSVAHDFNNVLLAISGHAELARLELPDNHPASLSLREVVSGTSRASLLCGQLQAFSGTGKYQRTTFDITAELHNIVGLLRPSLPAGAVVRVAPSAPKLFVFGERSELQQVLLNVIVNAGEAMAETSGFIDVSIERESTRMGNQVLIVIQDQGPGIAAATLKKVFDPFYTTKDRGHGLGLASVKRIMNEHAGTIEMVSEPGKGTIVTLRLPETSANDSLTTFSRPGNQNADASTTAEQIP